MGILLAANNRSFMQEWALAYVSQELRGLQPGLVRPITLVGVPHGTRILLLLPCYL